jgi:CheY-like chemotaxis protein
MARQLGTEVPSPADSGSCLSVIVLGDVRRAEFRESRASLDRWGTVVDFVDVNSAAAALAEGRLSPDLIVMAQAFPGQYPHEAIDRLRRLAPLARVLGLMGSWCEGEMRSGSPWPATVRTYWHQWPARGGQQLRRLAMGQSCSWALPLTATDEERLLVDASAPPCSPKQCRERNSISAQLVPSSGTHVAIYSRSREMADWLSAACRGRGLATIWQRDPAFARVEGARAAIFDGTDLCGDECEAMRRFANALRPAPVIALLSFPRIEDHRRALSAGASAVLSKPLLVEDLLEAVDRSITLENASQ